jgi:DNA-binding PadR family transcriptional regulator
MNSASTLEFALVGLLRQKAQAGYDLRKTFTETAMRHYSDSPGSIYPALRRLQARGWIEAEPKDSRGREVFHPFRRSVTAFLEWLSRDVTGTTWCFGCGADAAVRLHGWECSALNGHPFSGAV